MTFDWEPIYKKISQDKAEGKLTPEQAMLLKKLIGMRFKDEVSPSRPLKGKDIADQYNSKFSSRISDVQVREWVSASRCAGYPIGSLEGANGGYYWCVNETEWQPTKDRLIERGNREIRAANSGSDLFLFLLEVGEGAKKQAEADKLQADLFAKEHPVLGTMSETLLIAPVELSPEELERIRKRSEEVMEQATVFTGYAPEPPSEKKDGG